MGHQIRSNLMMRALHARVLRTKLVRKIPFLLGKRNSNNYCTVGQINQENRLEYWATRSSVRSFARTANLFACSALLASLARSAALTLARSLTSLTPELLGQ